jgi:hypothetical protein
MNLNAFMMNSDRGLRIAGKPAILQISNVTRFAVVCLLFSFVLIAVLGIRYSDPGSGILPAASNKEIAASMEQQ